MKKKIITIMMSAIITMSITGCSNNNQQAKNNNQTTKVEDTFNYDGTWANDYTRDEVKALYEEGLARVISTAEGYGLECDTSEDEIKEENGVSVNDTYVYFDIENPEDNRLESMYYGLRQFGSDLASGQIVMKLGFNLNKEYVLDAGEFKMEDLSLSAFSQAFTGNYERDYTELDQQIYNMIEASESGKVESIENNLDGLKETITITNDFLLYRLETKEYQFK